MGGTVQEELWEGYGPDVWQTLRGELCEGLCGVTVSGSIVRGTVEGLWGGSCCPAVRGAVGGVCVGGNCMCVWGSVWGGTACVWELWRGICSCG